MDYNEHSIEELLSDYSFRTWVLKPTAESELFWKNWLIQNPEKAADVEYARFIIQSLKFNEGELSSEKKSDLLNRIRNTNVLEDKNKAEETVVKPISSAVSYTRKGKKSFPMYLLRYAAILGGAIIFALSVDLILGDVDNTPSVQLVKKVNKQGQKSTIFLPDGSVANLNSSSTIVYPKEFTAGIREVQLNGEAFFEVTKDSKPFIVKMSNLEAKVLGTSFNARSYSDNENSSVSLVTGQVEVYATDNSDRPVTIILNPGEKAILNNKEKSLEKTSFSYDEDILWKDGILYFDKTPFREAVVRMEQWYGVKFTISEWPREQYEVTGKFNNEPLESVLSSISFTLRFEYKINGNKVQITW